MATIDGACANRHPGTQRVRSHSVSTCVILEINRPGNETQLKMEVAQEVIKTLLVSGKNYRDISTELKSLYPDIKRGLSERSVRRYVTKHNLRHVCETEKRTLIEDSVREVSLYYYQGWLLSQIIYVLTQLLTQPP